MAAACGGDADTGGDPAPADTAAGEAVSADPADPAATTGDATAELRDAAGNTVGTARFAAAGDGVSVSLEVTGLPPGAHGVHIHDTGECDASRETPFSSAGGHLNPTSRQHGLENANGPHAGDLPNLDVGSDGTGSLDGTAAQGTADALALLLDPHGAAIIVHANRDDQVTDDGPDGPGNSGARIACGVISR
jgi:Cu-Zn family superoxide dismutase